MNQQTQTLPGAHRAWMRLPSGRRLDLTDPKPDAWEDRDLAVRLARVYRWGGESSWPRPLSVAQHSLLVLAMVEQTGAAMAEQGIGAALFAKAALRELLHDAEEGFLGFDCISPLKRALGQSFADVSERLMAAVNLRYDLSAWTVEEHRAHKVADLIAAASEAIHCVGWTPEEVRDVLRLNVPILAVDRLAAIYGCTPWEPWTAEVAADRFLAKLLELTAGAAA
jgi:5'-deoxynucleotidase YfbR-like HD superfamily hydrolase